MVGFSTMRMLQLVVVLLTGIGLGCSSAPPKYPEDHARFERIVAAIETLRSAYVEEDIQTIQDLLLPLEDLKRFEKEVEQDFQVFSNISLDFSIERINIQEALITVHIQWQGGWEKSEGQLPLHVRGHGILELSGNKVILLAAVGGDLPFGMASKQSLL